MTGSTSGFGSLHMPRSRGALSGLLLIALGAWAALAPFIGPYFHVALTPGDAWVWTTARGWLQVLPGVAAVAGGCLLLISGNRAIAVLGGGLAAIAGVWLIVGRTLAPILRLGDVGQPLAASDAQRAAVEIAYFSGLGALIVFLGGTVLARVTIRTAHDAELERQAAAALAVSDSGSFAAARTETMASAPQHRRRDNKSAAFRRSRAGVTSH